MNKSEIHNTIVHFFRKYDPERVSVFGSYARNEFNRDSDIDILVKFKKTRSLLQLVEMEIQLSDELGIKVDLITEGALKNELVKSDISKDLKVIYKG